MGCVTHSQSHCSVTEGFSLAPATIAVGRREISQAGNKVRLTERNKS